MANNKNQETTYEEVVTETVGKTEKFFEKNQKLITWGAIAIFVIIGGYFANKYLIAQPRAEKASAEMFAAIQYFNEGTQNATVDSVKLQLALNGNDNYAGFLEVIDNYGSTPQGSLAAHYAGVCYLKLGDKENALKYLAQYDAASGAPAEIVNAQNLALQADLYVDGGQLEKAASLYRKAIDECGAVAGFTPYYLKKLGLVEEALGNKEAALEAFQRAKIEFGAGDDVNACIARLQK